MNKNILLAVVTADFKSTFRTERNNVIHIYYKDVYNKDFIGKTSKQDVWEYVNNMLGISNASIDYSPNLSSEI